MEKGLREAAQQGVLAGYPLVGLKATLYDGSYHPVDSNEMAFKTAAAAGLQRRDCLRPTPPFWSPLES
ncbi:MAG: hypothetical protein ACLT9P_09490 [Evtepia gabavorous]